MELRGACLLLLALSCMAFVVQPASVTVEADVGESFTQVFSFINDDPQPRSVSIRVDEYSEYLEEAVTLSEQQFFLRPEESTNIQISGTVPPLGPETHHLEYHVYTEDRRIADFSLFFPIPGTPELAPGLGVHVDESLTQGAVPVNVTLRNRGNIITYFNISLLVSEDSATLGRLQYPRIVQVLPGQEERLLLLYGDFLDPGWYDVTVQARVNQDRTLEESTRFRILLRNQTYTAKTGENLEISLKRYQDAPTVSYTLKRGSVLIKQNTLLLSADALTIPTATLEAGEYQLDIQVKHASGTDTLQIDLLMEEPNHLPFLPWLAALVILAGILSARKVRLHLRLLLLERRVRKKEKQLNELLQEVHRLSYGN